MFNLQPRPPLSRQDYESKITGGNHHLGDLSVRTFGKVVIFLDQATKSLHLVAETDPGFLEKFEPTSDSLRDILKAVTRLSERLGSDYIQRHKYIRRPNGVEGPVIGGAAVYFDGEKTLYFNATSGDFGPITKKGLHFCLKGIDKTIVTGTLLDEADALWAEKGQEEVNWVFKK